MKKEITRSEYLKRYLSKDTTDGIKEKKSKKSKKNKGSVGEGLKILDGDNSGSLSFCDIQRLNEKREVQADLLGGAGTAELTGICAGISREDLPVVAAVIDDRPPELRVSKDGRHQFTKSSWKNVGECDATQKRVRHDSDEEDSSCIITEKQCNDGDLSPPRTQSQLYTIQKNSDSDISPPRAERHKEDEDLSPLRSNATFDGKKVGLQKLESIQYEMEQIRRKDKKDFERLEAAGCGRNAETKIRGRLKQKLEEEKLRAEKNEITDLVKEQYKKWGRGIKQTEASRERLENDLHEMSKPLARFCDDVDRDAHLKTIERPEDPMLNYVRRKKAEANKGNIKRLPTYDGPEPPPNRFGISPGYRWDGVDRSSGFEKRFFERTANVKATEHDAYKWSTEDM